MKTIVKNQHLEIIREFNTDIIFNSGHWIKFNKDDVWGDLITRVEFDIETNVQYITIE